MHLFSGAVLVEAMIIIQAMYPIILSLNYETAKQERKNNLIQRSMVHSTKALQEELQSFLDDESLRSVLLKFLETELSVEYHSFLIALKELAASCQKEDKKNEDLLEQVRYIRDHFIMESGVSPIILAMRTRRDILCVVNEQSLSTAKSDINWQEFPAIFEKAKDEVTLMLVRDSFKRFVESKEYASISLANLSSTPPSKRRNKAPCLCCWVIHPSTPKSQNGQTPLNPLLDETPDPTQNTNISSSLTFVNHNNELEL
jgi:hypothetical protein